MAPTLPPVGAQVTIDRFPFDRAVPSHVVTGAEGTMLLVEPVNRPAPEVHCESRIPADEVVVHSQ